MEDIKIRLSVLEMKVDRIMKDISKSDSNNSFGLYHLVKPKGPPPSKKRPKTIKRNKGGNKYTWKKGDCVRPIGMPLYYIIKDNYDKDNWLMVTPSGGNHEITDIIPKSMETSGTWERVKCANKTTDKKSKAKSKSKSKAKSKAKAKSK